MSPPPAIALKPRQNHLASRALWLLAAVLLLCSAAFIYLTRHWPMVGDAALLRYTVFLIHRGWAPYRQIVDINMPGAYASTALGLHLAASPDRSWRIFDLGLVAVTGLGYYAIARPYSRFAAWFAAAMLLLVHGQDGVQQAGQRDLVMAALLVLAVAALLEALRRNRWPYLVLFGLAVGLSATIKPTSLPLGVVLVCMAATYRAGLWGRAWKPDHVEEKRGWLPWIFIGSAAMAAPLAGMLLWLHSKGALAAWVALERLLLPYYAAEERRSLGFALSHSISPLLALVLFWLLCVALRGPRWNRFERLLLAMATVLNLASLLLQGKALPYQRYPMLAFLLLLIALDLTSALQKPQAGRTAARFAALGGLCCGALVLAPLALVRVSRFDARPQEFDAMLQADLRQVRGGDLSGRVQCLDTIQDCLPTLTSMQLLPATSVLTDQPLFDSAKQPAVAILRQRFADEIMAHPPLVIVAVSGYFLDGTQGYRKLEQWPAFDRWLKANYTLAVERTPSQPVRWWGRSQPPAGYRLYELKPDTPVTNLSLH